MRQDWLLLNDADLLEACDQRFFRSGGPGGQKRDKSSSGVELKHLPSGVTARATESRHQVENRARALRRLRLAIALEVRVPIDPQKYTPPELIESIREQTGRIALGGRDYRYPALAAHLLDVLLACEGRLGEAANLLAISTGNLSKLVNLNEKVRTAASRVREQFGLGPVH